MATLLEKLKDASRIAYIALDEVAHCNDKSTTVILLQDFIDLIASFSDTLLVDYDPCAQVLLEEGHPDTIHNDNWLENAIARINLAAFTAAIWTERPELNTIADNYFSKVIPVDIEYSDAIIDVYFDLQARLLFHDIQAALDASEDKTIEAAPLYEGRFLRRRLSDYQVPPGKGGSHKILTESIRTFNELFPLDMDQLEQKVALEHLEEAWRKVLCEIMPLLPTIPGYPVQNKVKEEDVELKSDNNDYCDGEEEEAQPSEAKPTFTGIQLAIAMEHAEAAAKEYFRDATKSITEETIARDFEKSSDAPAFLVDVVRPYLLKLRSENTNEDLIDAACDAAASYRDELRIEMKLPVLGTGIIGGTFSSNIFRNLLSPPSDQTPSTGFGYLSSTPSSVNTPSQQHATPKHPDDENTQEPSTQNNVQIEDEPEQILSTKTIPEDGGLAQEQQELTPPPTDQQGEMQLSDVTNEGSVSPILVPTDASNGRRARSVAAAQRSLSQRRDVQISKGKGKVWPPNRAGRRQASEEVEVKSQNEHEQESEQPDVPSSSSSSSSSPSPSQQDQSNRQVTQHLGPTLHKPRPTKLRRLYKPWTDKELDALDEGVRIFGPQWALIKREYSDALHGRTNVDIKDKARNIVKQREAAGEPLEHWALCSRGKSQPPQ